MRVVLVFSIVALLSAGCASIGSPFSKIKPDYSALPADAMKAVAKEIETAIAKGEREPKIADQGGVVVNNESVMQAIRTRAARLELIDGMLNSGFAYEDNHGLITIQRNAAYKKTGTSQDRDRNAVAIISENQSRWTLYEGIVDASHFSPRALGAIQQIFHEARVDVLKDGQKYQDATGAIVAKGGAPRTAPAVK
ncbi:MAG: hypothetical protein HZB26_12515 [Candidatus Hydrogenedentes bacterium]|nr:hypothetical protein [Candidatus Hydrogenedentota bacterium]